MGKNKNIDWKQRQKDHKIFNNTIKDIRRLTDEFTNKEEKKTMGLSRKNGKMPLTHLIGRRKKLKERYEQEKKRAQEENIQYDSSSKLLNSDFMDRIRKKDNFVKNKYKFNDNIGSGIGRYKGGVLNLSDGDLKRINGNQERVIDRTKKIKRGREGGRKKKQK